MIPNEDYEGLKVSWNFPLDNDFSFDVFNVISDANKTVRNTVLSYNESVPSDYHNVYASTFNDFILDKYDNLYPVEVVVRVW